MKFNNYLRSAVSVWSLAIMSTGKRKILKKKFVWKEFL
jgi:hypothetical protein